MLNQSVFIIFLFFSPFPRLCSFVSVCIWFYASHSMWIESAFSDFRIFRNAFFHPSFGFNDLYIAGCTRINCLTKFRFGNVNQSKEHWMRKLNTKTCCDKHWIQVFSIGVEIEKWTECAILPCLALLLLCYLYCCLYAMLELKADRMQTPTVPTTSSSFETTTTTTKTTTTPNIHNQICGKRKWQA